MSDTNERVREAAAMCDDVLVALFRATPEQQQAVFDAFRSCGVSSTDAAVGLSALGRALRPGP